MAYATLDAIRALDSLSDVNLFTDDLVLEAAAWAETVIDTYCGTSFEPKEFNVTVGGHGADSLRLPVLFIRSVTTVTVDGVEVSGQDWRYDMSIGSMWAGAYPYRERGLFGGNIVSVVGTAGITEVAPPDIAWAARTLARQYLLDLVSRVPDRAVQLQSDFGTVTMAQAGGPQRPTSLPEVNAVLNRNRHRAATAF